MRQEKFEAYCTSTSCYGYKCNKGIKKDVAKSVVDCPDCGSVLFWYRVGKKRLSVDSKKKVTKRSIRKSNSIWGY